MKPANALLWPRTSRATRAGGGTVLAPCLLMALLLGPSCADDLSAAPSDADAANDGRSDAVDAGTDGLDDAASDTSAPFDLGPPPTEPPLTVAMCPADGGPGATCCASALGFEDGSTSHFLVPACCRMALSKPQIASTPVACGRGALRLDADFRATDATALCGQPGEAPACAFAAGEVSRAVLAPLDVTGLTMSAMVFVDGPALPPAAVHGNLFVLGRGGLIEGPGAVLPRTGVWTRLELRIADDGTAPGADIRVIGIRLTFHGQAWLGHAYIDEITWR